MNPAEYERMYALEDHYWWFVSRRALIIDRLQKAALPQHSVILDVGCGTGANAMALQTLGRVIGADISSIALQLSRRRGLSHLLQCPAQQLPLRAERVDVVVATDLLEHLPDDGAALREFHRVLRPGGVAVITVPAFRMLWGRHDVALMHHRRYRLQELHERAVSAGFRVEWSSYVVALLFPAAALARLCARRLLDGHAPVAQIPRIPRWMNRMLIGIQRLETAWLHRVRLPFGVSVVMVLRR